MSDDEIRRDEQEIAIRALEWGRTASKRQLIMALYEAFGLDTPEERSQFPMSMAIQTAREIHTKMVLQFFRDPTGWLLKHEAKTRRTRRNASKAKKKKAANPQVMAIYHHNPADLHGVDVDELKKAKRKYREFHGVDVKKMTRRGPKNGRPKPLIVLGRLIDIIYEPTRGQRRAIHWIHAFGRNARLCTDVGGKGLYIVTTEGTVQVDFSRGIVS